MERRFEAYKRAVVKPFFRDHFARIDRQIVLVDALGAIHRGPRAVEDMRRAMSEILGAFRPGRNAFLTRLLMGRQVETHPLCRHQGRPPASHASTQRLDGDHGRRSPARRATAPISPGPKRRRMAIAALRATTEETIQHDGKPLDCVRGRLLQDDGSRGKQAAFYPGELPEDPARLLSPAREGAGEWLDAQYQVMNFAPARLTLKPGEGPPHIRLDRAAQFLFGDRL